VALALAICSSLALVSSGCGHRGARPNIVVYVIDTLRADRLGVYGYDRPTSPAIDELAREGIVFDRAYSAAPWTLPSVASILTSLPPCAHGVVVDGRRLAPSLTTWAERLRGTGYATASFYANPYAGKLSGLDRGFAKSEEAAPGGKGVALWLAQRPPDPFFLYLHSVEPHSPYEPTLPVVAGTSIRRVPARIRREVNDLLGEYRALTRADWSAGRKPGETDTSTDQDLVMAKLAKRRGAIRNLYDGDVREADENLGSVVRALKEAGIWDDTIFAVTSDHGEAFGDHVGWQHDQSLYEELVRVPLVIHLPGNRFAGRRVPEPVSLLDLLPTLIEAAGTSAALEDAPGDSFWSWLVDGSAPGPRVVRSYRENLKKYYAPFKRARGDRNVAWVEGDWKAIWNAEPGSLELYELSTDPHEKRDRSALEPARARAMGEAARRWLAECTPPEGAEAPPAPMDEEALRRLRQLGYVD